MSQPIQKAYAEIYDIIYHMEMELFERIPESFFVMLEENMDKDYQVNIDYSQDINSQNLLPETRSMLALVYRNFICDDEEKKELNDYYSQKRVEDEQAKRQMGGGFNSLEERFESLNQIKNDSMITKEDVQQIDTKENLDHALLKPEKKQSFFQKILSIFGMKK